MKWYVSRLKELENAAPIISVCGDDCAVCPRYLARTEEELHETAVFWYKAGWRDHVVSNEEIPVIQIASKRLINLDLLLEILACYNNNATCASSRKEHRD